MQTVRLLKLGCKIYIAGRFAPQALHIHSKAIIYEEIQHIEYLLHMYTQKTVTIFNGHALQPVLEC